MFKQAENDPPKLFEADQTSYSRRFDDGSFCNT